MEGTFSNQSTNKATSSHLDVNMLTSRIRVNVFKVTAFFILNYNKYTLLFWFWLFISFTELNKLMTINKMVWIAKYVIISQKKLRQWLTSDNTRQRGGVPESNWWGYKIVLFTLAKNLVWMRGGKNKNKKNTLKGW